MDVKDLLRLLKLYGIRPRKKLSQVFLVNRRVLQSIARLAKRVAEPISRRVYEIGCGPATLTVFLLREGLDVVGIEIDNRFVPLLKMVSREFPLFNPVISDARDAIRTSRAEVVVGNLPYHISSELLLSIARSGAKAAVVTLQREVAERVVARPGTDSFGRLSVIMQLLFRARIELYIPPKYFVPRPEVSSATLVLERIRDFDEHAACVEKVTRCLFSYRNKLASKALRNCFPSTYRILSGEERWRSLRVRDLDPLLFLEIARICAENGEC
ncbi:MAG: ribosomal RNA small subunit methyltransferase A [Crenarchaeota archaeon]|nr:ribosomal RNA small subunit methyltransferase A [Thermoproteota archaeon]